MIKADLNEVSFEQLAKHIREAEQSPVKVKQEGGRLSFSFYPSPNAVASVSNLESICSWAQHNGFSIAAMSIENRIVVELCPV